MASTAASGEDLGAHTLVLPIKAGRAAAFLEVSMSRLPIACGVATLTLLSLACSSQNAVPTAPASRTTASSQSDKLGTSPLTSPGSATVAHLSAVLGTGSGIVKVTPTAADGGFSAQINVTIHGAPPNSTFYVQRAPEVGRANGADGVCQRAAGLPPWGPPAPNFVTFPLPSTGPLTVLQTSPGGAGSVHLDFDAAAIADGTDFDVMFRLVDDLTNPTNDLRTGCFTVTVK